MRVRFTKMEGCGNDYVYVDAIAAPFPVERAAELAARWSDRHFGIGADGLILMVADDRHPLRMRMWNADGSRGAMCGNGLRCLARFAAARGRVTADAFTVATDAGPRDVELLADGLVRASMGEVRCLDPRRIEVLGEQVDYVPGDAGNPHAVVFVPDVERADVLRIGAAMQRHPAFPDGVNVEFVHVCGPDRLRQRTFERGSGETLACGTGAAVAAAAARRLGNVGGERTYVDLRGGTISVVGAGAALAIEGPARTVFDGEVELP